MPYFVIILLFVLAGCGGGGSDGGNNNSAGSSGKAESISISDFYVVSTLALTETDVRSIINSRSIFYNNMPSSGGSSTENQCIDNLEDAYGITTKAINSYEFRFQRDIKDCRSNSNDIKSENIDHILTNWTRVTNGEPIDLTQYKYNQLPSASSGSNILKYHKEKIWNSNNKFDRFILTSSYSDPTQPCEWTNTFINQSLLHFQ